MDERVGPTHPRAARTQLQKPINWVDGKCIDSLTQAVGIVEA